MISLPASDTATSLHAQADDEEVGGLRGRAALMRLKNVIGRIADEVIAHLAGWSAPQ